MLVILARGATPESFAAVALVTGVAMFVGTLLDFGASSVLIVERARNPISATVSELLSWALQAVPLSVLVTMLAVTPLGLSVGLPIALAISGWLALDFLCEKLFGLLIADVRQSLVSALIVARRAGPLAIQGGLLTVGMSAVSAYSLGLLLGTGLVAIVSWRMATEELLRSKLSLRRLPKAQTIRHASWYLLAGLSTQARELEVAALHLCGASTSGYALAYRVFKPLSILGSTMAQVTLAMVAREGRQTRIRLTILVMTTLAAVGAALAVVLAPVLGWMLAALAGPAYAGLNAMAAALLIAALAATLSAPLGSALQAAGRQKSVAVNSVSFALIATGGCIALGSMSGSADAAAWVAAAYGGKMASLIIMTGVAGAKSAAS